MRLKLRDAIIAGSCAGLTCAVVPVQAKPMASSAARTGPVDREIQARYSRIEKLLAEHAGVDKIGQELYWQNVIVTGEGDPKTYRSLAELKPVLGEVIKILGDDCKFIVKDPAVRSGALAVVYSQLTCKYKNGQPNTDLRLLYTWEKRGSQWKVVRESYSNGPLR